MLCVSENPMAIPSWASGGGMTNKDASLAYSGLETVQHAVCVKRNTERLYLIIQWGRMCLQVRVIRSLIFDWIEMTPQPDTTQHRL